MLKHIFISLASLSLLTATMSCSGGTNEDAPKPTNTITVSADELTFDSEGGEKSFTVTATGEWDAVTADAWLKLVKSGTTTGSGSVAVTATANPERKERTATITLKSGASRATVEVLQEAKPAIPVSSDIDVPEGYELVWNDEFNGTTLDGSTWKHEVQGAGWVNNELQNYVNGSFNGEPVTEVADGKLYIHCFKQNGKIYSGRIYANVSTGWKYGIFEASIKLPKGRGTWPAFWMMPVSVDWSTEGWPRCGEIDIMEEVGYHANYTSSSIHCEKYNHVINTQKTAERLTQGAQDDFHTYRLEWTENHIYTYVDGVRLLSFENDGRGDIASWPFAKPFYVILNLAWGGDWGGAQGVDENALPATMEVEYVRVFQEIK